MRRVRIPLMLVLFVLMFAVGCKFPLFEKSVTPEKLREITNFKLPEAAERINAFTFAMLRRSDGSRNIVLSPQSVYRGLAMSYIASGGRTRTQLAAAMGYPAESETLLEQMAALDKDMKRATTYPGVTLDIANSLWVDSTYADFRKDYLSTVEKHFNASLHDIAFDNAAQASRRINLWASDKTHGRIKNVVSPADFASRSTPTHIIEPGLVSLNAVYFKADWGSAFKKDQTREMPFYVDGKTTEPVMMMHQESRLLWCDNDDFQFLEIPYVNGRLSMCILLPTKKLSGREMLKKISRETFQTLRKKALAVEVDVLLPKFEVRSRVDAVAFVKAMGAADAFDQSKADFDGMIHKKVEAYRVFISKMSQDAWIQVNEEGTEAAAATTTVHFTIGCSFQGSPIEFHADHPFAYFIVENGGGSILFAGVNARGK